jgi:hypothetical protein
VAGFRQRQLDKKQQVLEDKIRELEAIDEPWALSKAKRLQQRSRQLQLARLNTQKR